MSSKMRWRCSRRKVLVGTARTGLHSVMLRNEIHYDMPRQGRCGFLKPIIVCSVYCRNSKSRPEISISYAKGIDRIASFWYASKFRCSSGGGGEGGSALVNISICLG